MISIKVILKISLAISLFMSAFMLLSASSGALSPMAFAGRCTSDSDCNNGLVCDPKWKVCELDDAEGGDDDLDPPCTWELVWICMDGMDGIYTCYSEWLERCN